VHVNHDRDRRVLDGSIEWDELHPETKKLLSRRRFMGNTGKASLLLFGAFNVVLAACGDDDDDTASAATSATTVGTVAAAAGQKSLYERLGGNAAISAVITDFVDEQVVPDTRINAFFANTDLTRLKQLLTEFTDQATGGPETYTGRDMKSAHAGLGITMAAFNALVEDLSKSLDVFMVPAQEKGELLAALAPLAGDIVTA
jgi:hemoglobin